MWYKDPLAVLPCDACGSKVNRPVITRPDGLSVVECIRCGLTFVNPRPSEADIRSIYNAAYFARNEAAGAEIGYSEYASPASPSIAWEQRCRLEAVRDHASILGSSCLEVGCAFGHFASLMRKHGATVTGIDLSEAAVARARAAYPEIEFLCSTVEGVDPSRQFDVVVAFEVIEHVVSPKAFLIALARFVRPGGVVFLSTPNLVCARSIGIPNWVGFHTSFEHLFFFTPASLGLLAESASLAPTAFLSGGGTGSFTPPAEAQPRRLIASLPIPASVRRMRQWVRTRRSFRPYRLDGKRHNLLAVMRKPVALAG